MSEHALHAIIIGGGLGGLCLAQGLKKAGVRASVYERDETPSSRLQGFRIHIDPQGSTALHECLPADLWEIFDATGGDFSQGFSVLTEQLEELLTMGVNGERPAEGIARHRSISRITLRHVLRAGLEDSVHFNKRFVRYEEMADGRLQAMLEDGSSALGDVLIGADGVHSAVRKQYLPELNPVDTGVVALGGKVPLSAGVMSLAPVRLLDGPVMVLPPEPCSLFMAMWKRSAAAQEPLRHLGIEELPQGDENYMILGLGGKPEFLGLERVDSSNGKALKDVMRRRAARWHPNLRKLVEMADEREMSITPLRTSVEPAPWKTTPITLLGDAIHSMTPYRGIGANIALKDAALLSSKLAAADSGKTPLIDAIGEYEREMRKYAFAAVKASLKSMEQAVGEKSNSGFKIAKTAMRVINAVPVLKRRLIPA